MSDFRTLLTELENDQLVVLPRRPWLNTLGQTYFLDRFWTPTKLWDSILPAQPRDGGCFYTTPLQYQERQWFMPAEYAGGALFRLLVTDQPSTVVALVSDSSGPFVHLCADLSYRVTALTTPLRSSDVMHVDSMSHQLLMIYSLQRDPEPCPSLPMPRSLQPAVRQNALQPMAKAAGGRAYLPQPAAEFTPDTGEAAALDERFNEQWNQEVEARRSALAPRWNARTRQQVNRRDWSAVEASWDAVNAALELSRKKHVRRLHALRRTRASVSTPGTWIYALWTLDDPEIYIGQVGAQGKERSVGCRGRDHVRLGQDMLRMWMGGRLRLPSRVYEWIGRVGPERFVITPLEFVPKPLATLRENNWMRAWGLGKLKNRSLPPLDGQKWAFLVQRKQWKRELMEMGGSLTGLARTIVDSKSPLGEHAHSPTFLLNLVTATERILTPAQHRVLYDRVLAYMLRYQKLWIPYRVPVRLPLLSPADKAALKEDLGACLKAVDSWPPELQDYLCARIRVISARTLQVRQVVRTPGLCKDPTAIFLDPHSGEPCTCQSWDAGTAPRLSRLHGHVFTRNMEDVAACMHAFDTGVLRQNMKNATVPPWGGFCQALQKGLRQLTHALPDTRIAAAGSLLQSLAAVCRGCTIGHTRNTPHCCMSATYVHSSRSSPGELFVMSLTKGYRSPMWRALISGGSSTG